MRASESNRRDFLGAPGAAAAAVAALPAVHAAGADEIKVGLIGCGGRGKGAAADCLKADKAVKLVAVGDVFPDRAEGAAKQLAGNRAFAGRVDLGDRVYSGFDNYQNVINAGVDLVILATPPGFRPVHLEAAVKAGKHVFCEKPVAVDAAGIRKCLSLVEESKKKNLAIVAGTQRRHQLAYLEVYKRVADGEIGDIVGGRCSWNGSGIWFNARKPGMSDVEYQLRNWYHFLWLCGDHIVEQHVHNIDVINWFTGKRPVRAVAMGGRMGGTEARPNGDPKDVGHIWDHFAVEFEYPGGVRIASYCRHYPGPGDVSEMVVGTKGTIRTDDKNYYLLRKAGAAGETEIYSAEKDAKKDLSPYVREHMDLIAGIRAGKPLNELQGVTESTMSAILGREAAYTGANLSWDRMLKSRMDTMPSHLSMNMDLPVTPVPRPGVTKFA
jgi:predicted dehydrogenase